MKLLLKIIGGLLLLIVLFVGGFFAYVQITGIPSYETQPVDLKVEATPVRVARGKAIANMLCKQCHLDLATGKLTGHRLEDLPPDFGTAYSRNITRDPEHGVGSWTDGEIAYLLRTGIKRNGHYAPPWMVKLPRIADEDIYSIIAFLRSDDSLVQASSIPSRESQPSFLAKFLCHVAFKPFVYPDHEIKAPDIHDKVVYGKYIVQDVLSCYSCHSASFKTMDENHPEKSQGYLGGGNGMPGMDGKLVYTANLTPDLTGIGNLSEDDFVKAVREGIRPDGRPLRYPMTRLPELGEEEARAIYAYLKTVPPIHNEVNRTFSDLGGSALSDGKAIYHKYGCIACHGETGVGLGDLTRSKIDFPADSSLRAWIQNPPSFKPMTKMPPFKGIIQDAEYAPLMAYVRQLSDAKK